MKTKKVCSVEGCSFPLFARGFCSSHYKTLYLYPKMNELDRIRKEKGLKTPKLPKIKKEVEQLGVKLVRLSSKTKEAKYRRKRAKFIEAKRALDPGGRLFCIFCGKIIREEPSLHHYDGRDGSLLLDETKWLLGHNRCHVFEYHSMGWKRVTWWDDYLERIKYDYPELYLKELKKMEK